LFACNGILFNHESPKQGETFPTRKITKTATRIKLDISQAKRFFGYETQMPFDEGLKKTIN